MRGGAEATLLKWLTNSMQQIAPHLGFSHQMQLSYGLHFKSHLFPTSELPNIAIVATQESRNKQFVPLRALDLRMLSSVASFRVVRSPTQCHLEFVVQNAYFNSAAKLLPNSQPNSQPISQFLPKFRSLVHKSRRSSQECVSPSDQSRRRIQAMATSSLDADLGKTLQSWEALAAQVATEDDSPIRLPNAKTRTFAPGQAPALVFYRDNSSWCPYCERVWLQLEEKQIPYSVEKINLRCYGPKPAWFTKMVPSGLLPVVNLDGRVVTESMDIMFLIEERFPDRNPLLPSELGVVEELLRLERKLVGAWLNRLKGSWGDMGAFEKTMNRVDEALGRSGGPYFLGKKFSMVDAVYAPFLERIAASMPYWPGLQIRSNPRWPSLNLWYSAMDTRPAYQAMKSDDFTHTHDLEPQIGPCYPSPSAQPHRDLINGEKPGSWELPLPPEHTAWGFDDGTGGNGAKEEAARTLIENHEAVVGFALRGVREGQRERLRESVDEALRVVANALVVGVDAVRGNVRWDGFESEVAVAARYLRERVGVPRDMQYPAARQLRAHLNWLIRSMGSDL